MALTSRLEEFWLDSELLKIEVINDIVKMLAFNVIVLEYGSLSHQVVNKTLVVILHSQHTLP